MLSTVLLIATLGAVDAPVTDVTVFSDRARVVRTAQLSVQGTRDFELCTLLDSVDRDSVQVEASGAGVVRVDLKPVTDDELPVSEARALLTELEKLDDTLARAQGEHSALEAQQQALQKLAPATPTGDPLKSAPRLSSGGWSAAVGFTTTSLEKLQARLRELDEQQRDLGEQRAVLTEKAALLGGARRRQGSKVVATLSGNGPAKVTVTYFAYRARWSPAYDVQLQPDTGQVLVSFAGLVSQESGEDWADAALTLSTAIPATATVFPKLLTWKIGLKERFIPTPVPMTEAVRPPPPVPPLPGSSTEVDALRSRLAVVTGQQAGRATRSGGKSYDFDSEEVSGALTRANQKSRPAAPPPPPPPAPMQVREASAQRGGADGAPAKAPMAQAASVEMEEVVDVLGARRDQVRTSPFSLSPPPSWVPPQLPPDSATGAAGGYDLSWPSLQKETVPSGRGARRVALFAQTWPVTTERKVFPALFPEAFLVAELKNPSSTPLPGGRANLFVGADPAGTAQLKLVSPGEAFTLPLGIDRAIRPVRNVKVVDSEQGLVSKEDVSEYTVTIELANPYRAPIVVRIADQYPLTDNKDVEVKLLETRPQASMDKVRGGLEWRVTVPGSQKTQVSFKYIIRRPKGWRMQQWEEQR